MAKTSSARSSVKRRKSAGRSKAARSSRFLRAGVVVAMAVAVVILLSLAFSGGVNRQGETSPPGGSSDSASGPRSPGGGPVALLLSLDHEVPEMIVTEIGAQTVTDIATGAKDQAAERSRLEAIGFREAAITVGIKSPEAAGPFAGSDLVIQLVRFEDARGAQAQSERDRAGALAADFGAASPGTVVDSALVDGGFTFVANGPATQRGQSSIRGVALHQGEWTISVVATSPPWVTPATEELVSELALRQAARLRGS